MATATAASLAAAIALSLTGCGPSGGTGGTTGEGSEKKESANLQGAGATFPAPLYLRWFNEYNKIHPGVQVNYQAVGSGAGIKNFIGHLVDFGASDAAMTDAEIAQVKEGVILLPMTAGSIVLTYNLPGLSEPLKLSRSVYTNIFLGNIKTWNDPAIAADNPGVTLPDIPITVVRRADASGTTYVFTSHLAAISPEWKEKVGADKTVQWPVGIGGKGNEGVTAAVKQTPGAIGYVEFGYAEQTKLPMATLQNKAGNFVIPNIETGSAALAEVTLPPDLRAWDTDPDGANAYPIVSFTWWLCYKTYPDANKAAALKKLAHWCLTEGQKIAPSLGYLPLPENVSKKVEEAVDSIQP